MPVALPPEIVGWNWGGFLLSWMWAIRNRVWAGLWALFPLPAVFIAVSIILGVKGTEWSWGSGRWSSVAEFKRSQRRWAIGGVIFWVVLIAAVTVAILAVESSTSSDEFSHTMSSDDGSISIRVPGSWSEMDLHSDAVIEAGNLFEETYVIVLREPESDRLDLETFSQFTRESLMASIDEGSATRLGTVTIDGDPALQYEIRGVAEGLRVAYIHTSIDSSNGFVQILAWTLEERYDDKVSVLQGVTRSLREGP